VVTATYVTSGMGMGLMNSGMSSLDVIVKKSKHNPEKVCSRGGSKGSGTRRGGKCVGVGMGGVSPTVQAHI
jgi:hypothetical protein